MSRRSVIVQVVGGIAGAAGLAALGVHHLDRAEAATAGERAFAERYQGRWIAGGGPGAQEELERQEHGMIGHHHFPVIAIDGVPLHVVRNADGSYSTASNHYERFPTLLAAARAAAESLQGASVEAMA
ncbi:tyrosinase family oxidase copper chaperone [Lentzea sp. E54]|uniref:tyrosinase family oxidase copper chaperone n=1 Tax=Lentzea xerophila TaxID=3435883 RepID=UPI003DA51447